MIGGGNFRAKKIEPAAITASVDRFAVHKGLNGGAAADGMLLGVVKKNGGIGVNRNDAEIRESVALDLAGGDGLALLLD